MILVTGATGLLGSRLLYDLSLAGMKVKALRRNNIPCKNVDRYFKNHPDLYQSIDWVDGDVTDIFSLEEAMQDVEQVYHCAGSVSFVPSQHDLMHHVNIIGTANVVNQALLSGIKKICHVSSIAALGRNGSGEIITEDVSWKSSPHNSSYAVSKYGAEREVWRGIAEGLNAVIINPGVIIGPGNWTTDSSLIIGKMADGLSFYTTGVNGFVDVRDVTKAMMMLMKSNISGERFIVVAENKPFRDVFNQVAAALDKKPPGMYAGPLLSSIAWRVEAVKSKLTGQHPVITRETARSANGKYYYSSEKIKQHTGFEFRTIEESIAEAVKYFKKENPV